MRKTVKLNENTVAIIENRGVSIVQNLFDDKSVVILSLDDINQILEDATQMIKKGKQ